MLKLCTELLYCWMQHPAKYKAIWMKSILQKFLQKFTMQVFFHSKSMVIFRVPSLGQV
jgi:hypothetical protein